VALTPHHRSHAVEVIRLVERWVTEGFLPAAPRERACDFCDYRLVCGPYEELRAARKRPDRLAELTKLRGRA
jgi:hypothetical protein